MEQAYGDDWYKCEALVLGFISSVTYLLRHDNRMDMILGILFILAKGSWPFALPQLVTYWLTGGDELVNELYLPRPPQQPS